MFIIENYRSIRSLKTKKIIFHEKFSSSDRKMDFYFTTSASTLPCFQITWIVKYGKYTLAKFTNVVNISITCEKALPQLPKLAGNGKAFPCAIYTKFANFVKLYFLYFKITIFCNQTWQERFCYNGSSFLKRLRENCEDL